MHAGGRRALAARALRPARHGSCAAGPARLLARAWWSVPRTCNRAQRRACWTSAGGGWDWRGAVCERMVAGRWPRGRRALPGMDPVPLGQPDHARAHGGRCRVPATGCTHTCSCTEPCSCSCVRHRCSGRARQDGVKSWPLCANRKPGCRAIAARSVTTRQRGVHTLLHSAQPSESLAPCHTLA